MAKDPAFLFYPGDWLGGTTGMSFEEKGAYMELLVMQFNKGAFTIEQAKKLLNGSFERIWPELIDKFIEVEGKFFNTRLEEEKTKRQEFTESRRKNRSKKTHDQSYDKTYDKHMSPHMENENENINDIDIGSRVLKKEDQKNENPVSQKKPSTVPIDFGSASKLKNIQYPFNSQSFRDAWNNWKEFKKKEFKFQYKSEQSENAALNDLGNISNWDEQTAIAIIDQSISKGWKGLFHIKTKAPNEIIKHSPGRTIVRDQP